MSDWGGMKSALNSTIGTNDYEPLDVMIKKVKEIMVEIDSPGTFKIPIPKYAKKMKITASGGGGYGFNDPYGTSSYYGSGGGGGACIKDKIFDVKKVPTLTVTVGAGGVSNVNTLAESTIIDEYITLEGGKNGEEEIGGKGGLNAGNGGNKSNQNGTDSLYAKGGVSYGHGSGGGASLGNGGNGGKKGTQGKSGTRGSGGGAPNGNGGNGYVLIEWIF